MYRNVSLEKFELKYYKKIIGKKSALLIHAISIIMYIHIKQKIIGL